MPRKAPPLPNIPAWTEPERLAREKEALGFFISGHPLDRYREVVRAYEPVASDTLVERPGRLVALPCVVTAISRQISRRDSAEWGKVTVEDFKGTATVLAFGDVWQRYKEVLQQDAVVEVVGRVSGRERDEENPPIFLDSARPLDAVAPELAVQIELEFGAGLAGEAFEQARRVLGEHPGSSAVWFQVGADNGERAPKLKSRSLRVDPGEATIGALQRVFGRGNVRLVRTVQESDSGDAGPRWRGGRREAGSELDAG